MTFFYPSLLCSNKIFVFRCLSLEHVVFHPSHLCRPLFLSFLPFPSLFIRLISSSHLVSITCRCYSLSNPCFYYLSPPSAPFPILFHLPFPVSALFPFPLHSSLTHSFSFSSSPQLHRRKTTNLSCPWGPRPPKVKEGRGPRLTDRWYGTRVRLSPPQRRRWGRQPRPCPQT